MASAATNEVFFEMTWIILAVYGTAKFLGILANRIGLPGLVGEIIGGVLLGNLSLFGIDYSFAQSIAHSEFFVYAAELGVIFLLFLVGLESNLSDLFKAGRNSLLTAVIGVVLPTLSGYFAAQALGLGNGLQAMLVGATFAATSVGVTAKLLKEAGKLKSPSSQIILGAAVIDDVLGLMLLAVLAGIASSGQFEIAGLGLILLKILIFFGAALLIGHYLLPHGLRLYQYLEHPGLLTVAAVMMALFFSNLALVAGLAPIIGAFTAGLLLDEVKLRKSSSLTVHHLEETVKPITDFLLPIFFVSIGVQIQLAALFNLRSLLLIVLLSLLAFFGKALSGILCKGKGLDRIGIGVGMVPRGEVGLIFAAFGLQQNIIGTELYSILVAVVLITTVLGPALLKLRFSHF